MHNSTRPQVGFDDLKSYELLQEAEENRRYDEEKKRVIKNHKQIRTEAIAAQIEE